MTSDQLTENAIRVSTILRGMTRNQLINAHQRLLVILRDCEATANISGFLRTVQALEIVRTKVEAIDKQLDAIDKQLEASDKQ